MKKIFIIFLIILAGCVSSNNENKISFKEKQRNDDIQNCKFYGFKQGTSEFSNCLMKLDNARRHAKTLECENVKGIILIVELLVSGRSITRYERKFSL